MLERGVNIKDHVRRFVEDAAIVFLNSGGQESEAISLFTRSLGPENHVWVRQMKLEAQFNKQPFTLEYIFGKARHATLSSPQTSAKPTAEANVVAVKCFNCKKFGHVAANCELPKQCLRCKSTTHWINQCEKPCRHCNETGHLENKCLSKLRKHYVAGFVWGD